MSRSEIKYHFQLGLRQRGDWYSAIVPEPPSRHSRTCRRHQMESQIGYHRIHATPCRYVPTLLRSRTSGEMERALHKIAYDKKHLIWEDPNLISRVDFIS